MASEALILNTLERREFLLDSGSLGNLNFAVIASYQGGLNKELVQTGLVHLQRMHPRLQLGVKSIEKVTHFIKTASPIPFQEYPYLDSKQWRDVVKKDLAARFTKENEPLWRVSLLSGNGEGQLILTFHHAIADGVCAMEIVNHLFRILSELLKHQTPTVQEFHDPLPNLRSLYPLSEKEPSEDAIPVTREDRGYHTQFVRDIFDESTTAKVLRWTKEKGIRVNATLFAALLLAVRRVANPRFEEFATLTVVNYRSSFKPPISKEVVSLLRTGILGSFSVQKDDDLAALAQSVHKNVYTQLDSGEHVYNLKVMEKQLSRDISPQELWQRAKLPDNALTITNVGAVEFQGDYKNLYLNELFFVANVEPFIESPTNFILGTVTFRGKIFPTLWFVEEIVDESIGQSILSEMKRILSSL